MTPVFEAKYGLDPRTYHVLLEHETWTYVACVYHWTEQRYTRSAEGLSRTSAMALVLFWLADSGIARALNRLTKGPSL